MKTKTKWKFLRTGMKSEHGKHTWKVGEWYKEENIEICKHGFHASNTPLQALGYVNGEILAEVEVHGKQIKEDNKSCHEEMRVVRAFHWTKEDSVELAIFGAEQVIEVYEKKYPKDDRPRKAIEAAKKYLEAVKAEDKYAAHAATYAAARASAYDAAYAAAHAAYAAAYAAGAADAARKKLIEKLDAWFMEKVKTLEEVKGGKV